MFNLIAIAYNTLFNEINSKSHSKPKGYKDISSARYDELLQEVVHERMMKERPKSKRPQTAHYDVRTDYRVPKESKPKSK